MNRDYDSLAVALVLLGMFGFLGWLMYLEKAFP